VIELVGYHDPFGVSHFAKWRASLDAGVRARIDIALDRLERGNDSVAKSVGAGVSELRLDFGPGYRVYFGRDGETLIVLLGGGTKKRQQADIERAKELWQEYKRSKGKKVPR
jgi:putative addiction module killer protein